MTPARILELALGPAGAVVVLAIVLYAIWRAARWLGVRLVEPLVARAIAAADAQERLLAGLVAGQQAAESAAQLRHTEQLREDECRQSEVLERIELAAKETRHDLRGAMARVALTRDASAVEDER